MMRGPLPPPVLWTTGRFLTFLKIDVDRRTTKFGNLSSFNKSFFFFFKTRKMLKDWVIPVREPPEETNLFKGTILWVGDLSEPPLICMLFPIAVIRWLAGSHLGEEGLSWLTVQEGGQSTMAGKPGGQEPAAACHITSAVRKQKQTGSVSELGHPKACPQWSVSSGKIPPPKCSTNFPNSITT